ncbi:hypothetical protein ABXN37_19640 [Piscinibacter sakaiensis]|uniref:Uncharacterized protein n=1 Tax=Piscinibacter sakaiensis TaxID=1547922 RepID=A0A0K8P442_PISS1|nr:hypothetical protein [Piscinibacter sakaiensis]GAP37339.1 hypothetical protein ISF6_3194 [Piscinibacter sakaiensis]
MSERIELEAALAPIEGDDEEARAEALRRWEWAARRERVRWSIGAPCHACGEWVGHWGGSVDRTHCSLIPLNVPLEEVRPNCVTVRRHWIGDAIRAVCKS